MQVFSFCWLVLPFRERNKFPNFGLDSLTKYILIKEKSVSLYVWTKAVNTYKISVNVSDACDFLNVQASVTSSRQNDIQYWFC